MSSSETDDAAWLQSRPKQLSRTEAALLGQVVDGLHHPFGATPTVATPPEQGEFAAVCAIFAEIGRRLRRRVNPPTASQCQRADIADFAEANGLIIREVQLSKQWWHQDFGPLLAWRTDGTPVALFPRHRGYQMWTPAGSSVRWSADQQPLRPQAFAVIAQLPKIIDSPWVIARYGLSGNTSWLVAAAAVSLAGGLITMTAPLATKAIWDIAVPQLDYSLIATLAVFLVAASLAGMVLRIIEKFANLRVSARYQSFIRPALWFRLQHVKMSFYRQHTIGEIAQQVELVPGLFSLTLKPLFSTIGLIGFGAPALWLMFWFSPQLTWLALAATLVRIALSIGFGAKFAHFTEKQLPLGAQVTSALHQLVAAVVPMRLYGTEAAGLQRWWLAFRAHQQLGIRIRYWRMAAGVVALAFPILVVSVLYWYAGTFLLTELSVGDFLAFMTAYGFFRAAAKRVPAIISVRFTLPKIWHRCLPLFAAALEPGAEAADIGLLRGDLRCVDVCFRYPDTDADVLTRVNLQIAAGSFVGITGDSGSGKSTLARLLSAIDEPTDGVVLIDGHDGQGLDRSVLRPQIAMVSQDMAAVGSDLEQLVTGGREVETAQLWQALAVVGLDEQVRALPMGLATAVGPNGGAFSGGELQRLLLARALLTEPAILILDEATSALDETSQAEVMTAIAALPMTRVVIAHRLSTLKHADQIVVLQDGGVAEVGDYDELAAGTGEFAQMLAAQD